MTIKEILKNINLAPLDRELLLSWALKRPKEYICSHPEYKLSLSELRKFNAFAKRRVNGEPVAYITGKKEFFGLDFEVNKNVLIPRPETEMLVEKVLNKPQNTRSKTQAVNIIDIGTGSGNIIISIVKNTPAKMRRKVNFYAVDISKKALNIAKKNAKKHRVEKSIKFIESDLLGYFLEKKVKLENLTIVANLPYVPQKIYQKHRKNLMYEPKNALVSGKNGLDHYIRLIGEIRKIWESGQFGTIYILIEISPEQKSEIDLIIKKELPETRAKFSKDLSGRWRIAEVSV